MSKLAVAANAFFQDVAVAPRRVLLLDYDRVLSAFCRDRGTVPPYLTVADILKRIMLQCSTRVIVVSELPAHQVRSVLGIDPVPEIWGSDGLERIFPDGRYECSDLDVTVETLTALSQCEEELTSEGLGPLLEVRLAGVAVHWKDLNEADALEVRSRAYRFLQPLAAAHPCLSLTGTSDGVRLRLRVANRGEAVDRLLAMTPLEVPLAYLGDSLADEDAFRCLNGRGLTVLLEARPRFTAAVVRLRPPEELVRFLEDWVRVSDGVL